jgi:3-methylcrotonyl-CoA carboxylase beta subunit
MKILNFRLFLLFLDDFTHYFVSLFNILKNDGKEMTAEQLDLVRKPILDKYEKEGHPYFASARLWDDGVIQPTDTRRILIQALKAVKYNPVPDPNFPVFRM